MQSLSSLDLNTIPYYTFKIGDFAGFENVLISSTGYTGSGGFEIYCKNSEALHIWTKVFEAGHSYGIKPIGLAARDTLRLEMGYCLYGNEINDATSPIEAGLSWITKFNKDFVNHKALAQQKNQKPEKKLVGFELNERGIPRQGYDIVAENGAIIGNVTSGTMSPSLQKGIGMGYVSIEFSKPGTQIYIQVRKKAIPAVVVKMPFYKK
jgi:aminomethyltransferase